MPNVPGPWGATTTEAIRDGRLTLLHAPLSFQAGRMGLASWHSGVFFCSLVERALPVDTSVKFLCNLFKERWLGLMEAAVVRVVQ